MSIIVLQRLRGTFESWFEIRAVCTNTILGQNLYFKSCVAIDRREKRLDLFNMHQIGGGWEWMGDGRSWRLRSDGKGALLLVQNTQDGNCHSLKFIFHFLFEKNKTSTTQC